MVFCRLNSSYKFFLIICVLFTLSFVGRTILNHLFNLKKGSLLPEALPKGNPGMVVIVRKRRVAVTEKLVTDRARKHDQRHEKLSTGTNDHKAYFMTPTNAAFLPVRSGGSQAKRTTFISDPVDGNRNRDSTVLSAHGLEKPTETTHAVSVYQTLKAQETVNETFNDHWCRLQYARVDWKSYLRTCQDHTVWEDRNIPAGWEPTDSRKSFITSWEISAAGEFSSFFIQSVTATNRTKSTGGDAWRIHLRGPSSLAPTVVDHGNGKYEAFFLPLEAGTYRAMIFLDYTLCDGLTDPPRDWFKKGNSQGKNQPEGTLLGHKPYLLAPFRAGETVEFSVPSRRDGNPRTDAVIPVVSSPCAHSCKSLLWDGLGRWVSGTWKLYVKEPKRRDPRNKEGTLWIFGDSVANGFYNSLTTGPYKQLCTKVFSSCQRAFHWVYDMKGYWGDGVTSPREPPPDGKDYDHGRVMADLKKILFHRKMDTKSVLVLNLGIHYVAAVNFTNYKRLIDDLITVLRKGGTDPDGGQWNVFRGRLIWKTTTALNRHRFPWPHRDVRRFLTFPRVELYNVYATSAMCRAGIDVIDVYPISNSFPGGTVAHNDPVHYSEDVFRGVERLLFEMFRPQ